MAGHSWLGGAGNLARFKCGHCGRTLTVTTMTGKDFNKTLPVKICEYCDAPEPPARPVAQAEASDG